MLNRRVVIPVCRATANLSISRTGVFQTNQVGPTQVRKGLETVCAGSNYEICTNRRANPGSDSRTVRFAKAPGVRTEK